MTFPMWNTYTPDPTYYGETECTSCRKVCDLDLTEDGLCGDCQDIELLPAEIEEQEQIARDLFEGPVVCSMAARSAREKRARLMRLLKRTGREV